MRHVALIALLVVVASCSVVRRGPDLSGGGLELVFTIAPEPDRAAQEAALAREAAQTMTRRLEAAGCRGVVEAAGRHVRVLLPSQCGDLQHLKQLLRREGRLELREVAADEACEPVAAAAGRLAPESGVTIEEQSWTARWSAPTGRVHRCRTPKGSVEALERLRAGLAPDAVPRDVEALIEPPPVPGQLALLRLVKREVGVSGAAVREANVVMDQHTGRPHVSISFSPEGGDALARLTKRLAGRRLAIVLDDRVTSAPVVQEEIRGGKAIITLSGLSEPAAALQEAKDLALVLRSGRLPRELAQTREEVFPRPPAQELKLAVEGSQLVVRLSSGGLWRMGSPPTPAELAPVIATARAASRTRRVEILVRGAYDVPAPDRRAIVNATSDAGFDTVLCLKDNSNCR